MTKSKTWKAARDARVQRQYLEEDVETTELQNVICDADGWEYGWSDQHKIADDGREMIAIIYMIRPDCDECAVEQFKVYAGSLRDKAGYYNCHVVDKNAAHRARELIKNPPPPRLRTEAELCQMLTWELTSGFPDQDFIEILSTSLRKMNKAHLIKECTEKSGKENP